MTSAMTFLRGVLTLDFWLGILKFGLEEVFERVGDMGDVVFDMLEPHDYFSDWESSDEEDGDSPKSAA